MCYNFEFICPHILKFIPSEFLNAFGFKVHKSKDQLSKLVKACQVVVTTLQAT